MAGGGAGDDQRAAAQLGGAELQADRGDTPGEGLGIEGGAQIVAVGVADEDEAVGVGQGGAEDLVAHIEEHVIRAREAVGDGVAVVALGEVGRGR